MTPRRTWSIVALLCCGIMVAFMDRATLSAAIAADEFKRFFQLDDNQRGALSSAFFWSYALLQIPAGVLVDRWGVKRFYTAAFAFWGLAAGATAFARNYTQLFGLRMLLGVGEAPVTPASLKWITSHLPEEKRGLAVGLLFAAAKLGPAAGTWIAAVVMARWGWQFMFAAIGLGGLLWLIPWQAVARENPLPAIARAAQEQIPLQRLFATPMIYGVMVGTFSYNYFQYFCMTWLPAYFVERRGLSLNSMGYYTAFSFGGMAIVATAAGWAADRLIAHGHEAARVRRWFTVAGLLAASSEVIGATVESHALALAIAIVSLSGLGLATANYWALTQTLMRGRAIGRVVGVQNFASNVSGIAAPLITGWLKQATGSYVAPMAAVAVVLLLGLASYLLFVRQRYAPV